MLLPLLLRLKLRGRFLAAGLLLLWLSYLELPDNMITRKELS
jgi:hypothetical protein